jgi:hypothetical protein
MQTRNSDPVVLVHTSIPLLTGAVVSVFAIAICFMWAVYLFVSLARIVAPILEGIFG